MTGSWVTNGVTTGLHTAITTRADLQSVYREFGVLLVHEAR